jgi:hypothetical protein
MLQTQISCGITHLPSAVGQVMITRGGVISTFGHNFEKKDIAFAKEYKLEKWIEYDNKNNKYFPTALMEDSFHKYIDKYNARQK